MKSLLLSIACLVFAASVRAESPYQVDLVSTGKNYLYVDDSWQHSADCIEVKFSAAENTAASATVLKVYFYGDDGKLVHSDNQPSDQAAANSDVVKLPTEYKAGKRYEVFFGIPKSIKSGPKKWKRVVVVFGQGDKFSAKIYPKDDLAKFEFAEKAMVK